jgi:TDG/mug DNA glycosylase family protein
VPDSGGTGRAHVVAERKIHRGPATASAPGRHDPALEGLPPVLGRRTRVLILGSFPGVASLAAQQYYAHPRNHFWPLLDAILDVPLPSMPYRERLAALRAHGVGLWDTIVSCRRRGSLDGAIRAAVRGEVARARRASPALALVCFNGKTAARALPAWRDEGYATLALPSSSPAYTLPFADKLALWREIGKVL